MGCTHHVFVVVPLLFVCPCFLLADERGMTGGVWDNAISFSEETLEEYLPDAESDDRIQTHRFRSTYATHEKNPLPWEMGIYNLDKNYDTRNLDNRDLSLKLRIGKTDPETNRYPFTHTIKTLIKQKIYDDIPANSYDKFSGEYNLHYLRKKEYKISGYVSYDAFRYRESGMSDEDRMIEKLLIHRFFNHEKLTFRFGYKREDFLQAQAERKKSRNEYSFLCQWHAARAVLDGIRFNALTADRDARDEEGDDRNLEYVYRQASMRIEHKLPGNILLHHTAQQSKKEYRVTCIYDREGFEVEQGWKITPYNTNKRVIYVNVTANYKKYNYQHKNEFDFDKTGVSLKGTIRQESAWKTYAGLAYSVRDQADNTLNYHDYRVSAGYEKKIVTDFFKEELTLGIDLTWAFQNYLQKSDKELYTVKFNFNYMI